MALEAFLKIEGIPGESRKDGHKDEIDILSFSFGASNPTTIGKGSGAGASQVSISSFNIMKMTDLSSTAFFLRCAKGEHIPRVKIWSALLGKQIIAVVPERDQPEVMDRRIRGCAVADHHMHLLAESR